jgi:hypothetical protein
MRLFSLCLSLALAALLAGCATPTPKVNLRPGTLQAGQAIAVVEPPEIKQYWIWAPHPGMAFGMIGGAIAGAHFAARAEDIRKLMLQQGLAGHADIANTFKRELEAAGYQVEIVRAWKMDGDRPVLDMARVDAGHRHVLVLTPAMYGFMTDGVTGNYRPTVRVRTALYGPDRTRLLYDGYHVTGMKPAGEGWIYASSIETNFTSYDTMLAQPRSMADSLRRAAGLVAKSAVRELAVPGARPIIAANTPPPGADVAALAGSWAGMYKCGPYTGTGHTTNPNPWTSRVALTLQDGQAVLTRGGGEANFDEKLTGTLDAGLSVALQGKGSMRATPNAFWYTEASGRFHPAGAQPRFEGNATIRDARGTVMRNCTVELTKAAAG